MSNSLSSSSGSKPVVVAIDGPSGSGKSSTSKEIAKLAGWNYLDTGALYRALTWHFLNTELALDLKSATEIQIETTIANLPKDLIKFNCDPFEPIIFLEGVDINLEIRTAVVNETVSYLSKAPSVRKYLINLQREIINGAQYGIVVEGRDIGTVIAPDADLKIFLTADLNARSHRRCRRRDSVGQGHPN